MLQNPADELIAFEEERGAKNCCRVLLTYMTVMGKIGMHCNLSWDSGIKKRRFEQSPFNL